MGQAFSGNSGQNLLTQEQLAKIQEIISQIRETEVAQTQNLNSIVRKNEFRKIVSDLLIQLKERNLEDIKRNEKILEVVSKQTPINEDPKPVNTSESMNQRKQNLNQFASNLTARKQELNRISTNVNARKKNVNLRTQKLNANVKNLEVREQKLQDMESKLKDKVLVIIEEYETIMETAHAKKREILEQAKQDALALKEKTMQEAEETLAPLRQEIQELETKKKDFNSVAQKINSATQKKNSLTKNVANIETRKKGLVAESAALNTTIGEQKQSLQVLKDNLQAKQDEYEAKVAEWQANFTMTAEKQKEELNAQLKSLQETVEKELDQKRSEAQALIAQEEAEAKTKLAADLNAMESKKLAEIEEERKVLKKEFDSVAKEREEKERVIKYLEKMAVQDGKTLLAIQKEKADLAKLKQEQETLAAERTALEQEKQASLAQLTAANEEAQRAIREKQEADKEVQRLTKEKEKAEATEVYRKQVYAILDPWINPLRKEGIEVYHDNTTDDYFFQNMATGTRKDWIQPETIVKVNNALRLSLVWQPRPPKPQILIEAPSKGGRRKTRKNKSRRGH